MSSTWPGSRHTVAPHLLVRVHCRAVCARAYAHLLLGLLGPGRGPLWPGHGLRGSPGWPRRRACPAMASAGSWGSQAACQPTSRTCSCRACSGRTICMHIGCCGELVRQVILQCGVHVRRRTGELRAQGMVGAHCHGLGSCSISWHCMPRSLGNEFCHRIMWVACEVQAMGRYGCSSQRAVPAAVRQYKNMGTTSTVDAPSVVFILLLCLKAYRFLSTLAQRVQP